MSERIRFVGLDVSTQTIAVAIAEADGSVLKYGDVPNTPNAVRRLVETLSREAIIKTAYEAGPTDTVEIVNVIGDVDGAECVIVDDLISTGGTLASAAVALRANGAMAVDIVATHGVLSDGAIARLHEAPIDEICITDTIPYHNGSPSFDDAPKLRILSVAPLIAEAIVRVHEGRSVSELFR